MSKVKKESGYAGLILIYGLILILRMLHIASLDKLFNKKYRFYFLYVPVRLLCPADCRYPYQSGAQHIFRKIMLVIQRHRIDPSQRAALRGRSYKKNRHRKLSNAPDAEKSRRETTKPLL